MVEAPTTYEEIEQEYVGKVVAYNRFPHPVVFGMLDRLGVEDWKNPIQIIFVIDGLRYSEDIDDFKPLVKRL